VPVFYLVGERDRIRPVEDSLELLRDDFSGDRSGLLTIKIYPGVEHSLFEADDGGSFDEAVRYRMAPYMEDVVAWLGRIGIAGP